MRGKRNETNRRRRRRKGLASTGQVNEITRNRKLSAVRISLERPLPTQKSLLVRFAGLSESVLWAGMADDLLDDRMHLHFIFLFNSATYLFLQHC